MSVTSCSTVPSSFPTNSYIQLVNPQNVLLRVAVPSAPVQSSVAGLMVTTDGTSVSNDSTWQFNSGSQISTSGGQSYQIEQQQPYGSNGPPNCIGLPTSSQELCLVPVSSGCCLFNFYCAAGGYTISLPNGWGQVSANTTTISPQGPPQGYSLIVTNDSAISHVGGIFNIQQAS